MIVHLVSSILKTVIQKVESYGNMVKRSCGKRFPFWIVAGRRISDRSKRFWINLRPRFDELWALLCLESLIGYISDAAAWLLRNFSEAGRRPRIAISIALVIGVGVLIFSPTYNESVTTDNAKGFPYDSSAAQILDAGYDASPEVSEMKQSKSGAVTMSTETHNQPGLSVTRDEHEKMRVLGNFDAYENIQALASTQGAVVAILDSGIDTRQNDLDGLVISGVDFTDSGTLQDVCHHGTYVAAIIADGYSFEGNLNLLPWYRLLNVKVADDVGSCTANAVAKGIVWATDNGANIINLSLELREPSPVLEEAVNYAWNRGVLLVAAAGNNGERSPVYPAYYEPCIAVAAIDKDGELASLSNYGDWVDLAAPGCYAELVYCNTNGDCKTGTSFSCACVSRVAALLFSVVSDLDGNGMVNDEIRELIERNCHEIFLPSRTR